MLGNVTVLMGSADIPADFEAAVTDKVVSRDSSGAIGVEPRLWKHDTQIIRPLPTPNV